MFDAGALVFTIQTAGAQVFAKDQADAEKAVEKTGKAAQAAATGVDSLGTSTDETGKKAKAAKGPLDEQAKSTKKTGDESESASKKQQDQAKSTQQQIAAAKELSRSLLLVGAAVTAMVALTVVKHTEFDQAMSNVRAATMATAEEQKALGESALKAGADTAYSASEAAAAQEELAKAGQSVADIVGGSLNASLALAAAGQLQVARSAEIMATAMTQFAIPAENAAHVSDVLAAGAGKAQGSVDDLALALSYVGPLANQAGWSIDETAGTISYFASQGILGEKAGTSLRGVLAALQAPSSIAAKTMDQYGLSIYDANGNMLSASQIAGNLQKAFGSLSAEERNAAMGRIFGNESLLAANLLYAGGAGKVSDWTDAVNDSGYAARQAAMRQDNLAGDIEKLGGAFDTALIKTGSHANDVLRGMTQAVTELVDMYAEAPEPVQATAMVLGVATGAMALFAGGAVGARVKFLELKAQLDATNVSMGKTALIGGAAGLALTGVITVVALLAAKHAAARQKAESYADTLEEGTQRITKATSEMIATNLTAEKSFLWVSTGSLADNAETLGLSLDTVRAAIEGNADALEEVNAAIDRGIAEGWKPMKDANLEAHDAAVELQKGLEGEIGALDEAARVARQKEDATEGSAEASLSAADAYMVEAESVQNLASDLSKLVDTINEANRVNQDAISANIDYQETLRKVDEQIANIRNGTEGYAQTLDESTQAGSDNKAMLIDFAKDAWDAAKAQLELDGNTEGFIDRLEVSRQKLYDAAIAMGATEEEAIALRDSILDIPDTKTIEVIADTANAQAQIDSYIYQNSNRQIIVKIGTSRVAQGAGGAGGITQADGGVIEAYANGGIREQHVAQMARAGAWRVWAEPETGGESYVPHALSKRARSEQVMIETAEILGGTYIPAGASRFADGGVTTGAASRPSLAGLSVTGVVEVGGDGIARFVGQVVEEKIAGQVRSARRGAGY